MKFMALRTNIVSKKKNTVLKKILKITTAFVLVIAVTVIGGILYFNKTSPPNKNNHGNKQVAKVAHDLPRFKNMEQLKSVLKKNNSKNEYLLEDASETMTDSAQTETATNSKSTSEESYSTTNVQVENVDEADMVKTDGDYIYYVANKKVYIVKAKELTVVSEIEYNEETEKLYPREIYVYGNKMVVIGNGYEYKENSNRYETDETDETVRDYTSVRARYMSKAIVYDISNKNEPKQTRVVSLDGSYVSSRMIGENLYFISEKSVSYYDKLEDDELLPVIKDSQSSEETKKIDCTEIAYFEDTKSYSYMIVAGFNINNKEAVNTETFFGASSNIYASEKNLYVTQSIYNDGFIYKGTKNIIYKFNLDDSKIKLQCKGEVKGYLNNQFSMDEYEGNLRIATTSRDNKTSSNQLYVLDENLQEIGKIEDLAKGEKIYSVRFIGKVGYIVTFEQIDPLFVIDLSNPSNPVVKGQLKIPGYSSYLHPYDETHIIGIGYNTKSNGYGGVVNANMKMSMFDVSDLENPKEMFNVDIGDDYVYSQIKSNHKALFYNKDKNLIGFPIKNRSESTYKNELVIFKINLENGFEEYAKIEQENNYKNNIDRAIYIGEVLYTLSDAKIVSYDLNTIEKIEELELELE